MHAKIDKGQVIEYPIVNLRQLFPNASLPADLTNDAALPEGYVYVNSAPAPDYNPNTHKLVAKQPALVGDKWQTGYDAVPLSEPELQEALDRKSAEVRAERNRLLFECDWTQGRDIPEAVSTAWAQYRQELRDISLQPGFPSSVQWPVPPT